MLFTKKVNKVGTLPDGVETDVEIPSPKDGKSINEDGTDTEADEDPNIQ
jgi:hypothetical protein